LSGDGWGASLDEKEAEAVVARALDIGVTLIDTADVYAGGKMEALLGRVLESKKDVTVVTRGGVNRSTDPPTKQFTLEYLRTAVERSCKRLRRDALDVYLLHNPSPDALSVGEAASAMDTLKKEGKLRHWGVSAGDLDVARAAVDKGAEVLSMTYNLLHQADVNRIGGDVMVSRVGLLAHSPLSYGLLAGNWTKDTEWQEGDHRRDRWTRLELERRVSDLASLRHLVRGEVETMRGAAVRFVLSSHLISAVLLGPRNEKQLTELVRDTGGGPRYLPDDDLRELAQTLEKAGIHV
jgi:aryl-alcohol dehydrogenase-like predicted oxidoreductase